MNKTKQRLLTIILMGFIVNGYTNAAQKKAHLVIEQLYGQLNNTTQTVPMPSRLDAISAHFLGKPYRLGALGEGPEALYDQSPLYRIDSFDCETFVDTVLAIALANSVQDFKICINKIRYAQGQAKFTRRNHFLDLDWNKNNQNQGYLKDITLEVKDTHQHPVALMASAIIDKPSWYQHMTTANIKLTNPNPLEQKNRLIQLQQEGRKLPVTKSLIPYIPLTSLFSATGQPNSFLFSQIPDGSIVEIIRPNWNLRPSIGTSLNASHLGFVFRKDGQLIFRQASSTLNQVSDVPLIDYLEKTRLSPTIKGINIQIVLPEKPYEKAC